MCLPSSAFLLQASGAGRHLFSSMLDAPTERNPRMKNRIAAALAASLFIAGIGIGYAAQKAAPQAFHGKSKEDAARALLDIAHIQAGDGSWERIAIGRVLYLG